MAKTFKRIAALATAIALVVCFAVSASAINVTTTTQYAANQDNVNVTVNVTDGGDAAYVTYYATKDSQVVYVDQTELNSGRATFQYQTAATNLKGTVKVGYTGGADAATKDITANTISYNGAAVAVLPTATTAATVTLDYTPEAGMTVGTVTADKNATVGTIVFDAQTNKITVPLSAIAGDVTLAVTPKEAESVTAIAEYIDAAAIKVTDDNLGEVAGNTAEEGNRKLTVIGKATGAEEYGVVVSSEAFAADSYQSLEAFDVYEALANAENGLFAVQVIDQGEDNADATIASGDSYYVAIYVLQNGVYYIDAGTEPVTVQ